MPFKIQFKRGLKADLPTLDNGEVGFAEDTDELFIGKTNGNKKLTFDSDKHASLESQLAENTNKVASIYNVTENEHLKVAIADGYDWTTAIQRTIDLAPLGALVTLPPFQVYTTDTIITNGRRLQGAGIRNSIIVPLSDNPAISVSGRAQYLADFSIKRQTLSTLTPMLGVGVLLDRVSDASVFERIDVINCSSAFYSAVGVVEGVTQQYVYSTSFRDIRVNLFSHSALYLGADASTGCVLSNFYVVNRVQEGTVGEPLPAKYGIYINNITEFIGNQVNVEHGSYEYPIMLNYCQTVKLSSVHFEGLKPTINYRSVVTVQGDRQANVELDAVTMNYCTFDNVVTAFLSVDYSSRVVINGFSVRDNTLVNNPFVRMFYSGANLTANASIELNGFTEITTTFNTSDNLGTFTVPVLKKKNGNHNAFTLFGKTIIHSDSIPTTGTWKVGDMVLKVNPVAGNYIGYVCTTAGTPGTWKAWGAILA